MFVKARAEEGIEGYLPALRFRKNQLISENGRAAASNAGSIDCSGQQNDHI